MNFVDSLEFLCIDAKISPYIVVSEATHEGSFNDRFLRPNLKDGSVLSEGLEHGVSSALLSLKNCSDLEERLPQNVFGLRGDKFIVVVSCHEPEPINQYLAVLILLLVEEKISLKAQPAGGLLLTLREISVEEFLSMLKKIGESSVKVSNGRLVLSSYNSNRYLRFAIGDSQNVNE